MALCTDQGDLVTDREDDVRLLRAKPRSKLFQPTELRDAGGVTRRAHLLDVSVTGALVHAAEPPRPGETVQLLLGGAQRNAQVMWAEERRFGVRFRLPLTDAQVAEILSAQATVVAEAGRRTGPIAR